MRQLSVPVGTQARATDLGFRRKAFAVTALLGVLAAVGLWTSRALFGGHPTAKLFLFVVPLLMLHTVVFTSIAVRHWDALQTFLYRFAFVILLGAILATCVGVWGVNGLFAWVSVDLVAVADDPAVSTWFGAPLTLAELATGMPWLPEWASWISCLLWPLQYPLGRDLISLGAVMGFFNVAAAYEIWWERKVAGRIQSRLGPMRVGGWHGWAQSPADGIKLVLKEDLVPQGADAPLFRAAPYFTLIPSALAFVALPFGLTYVFRDLDVALLFILGMLGIEVVGVILAGWASNNKWSVYGAMREAVQMISYEIPMGMALLVPIVCVGSLSLVQIGEAQRDGWFAWLAFRNPFAFGAFVCYFVASLASCKRAPFDLPEAESELVAGFLTEYSGFRWAMFFFAEYAAMFVVSGLAVILFLGAWNSPLPVSWGDALGDGVLAQGLKGMLFSGPIWFVLKAGAFVYIQIWLRWTLPRIRLDQVLYACVQVLLPLTMLLLLGATLWVWASTSGSGGWATFDGLVRAILGAIGAVFVSGFVGIAGYGFYHRRRLVGNLAIDPLPGG